MDPTVESNAARIDDLDRRVRALEPQTGSPVVRVPAPRPVVTKPGVKLPVLMLAIGIIGAAGLVLSIQHKLDFADQVHPVIDGSPEMTEAIRATLPEAIRRIKLADAYNAGVAYGRTMIVNPLGGAAWAYIDEIHTSDKATSPLAAHSLAESDEERELALKTYAFHVGMAEGASQASGIPVGIGTDAAVINPMGPEEFGGRTIKAREFARAVKRLGIPSPRFVCLWCYNNRGNAVTADQILEKHRDARHINEAGFAGVELRPCFQAMDGPEPDQKLKRPIPEEFDLLYQVWGDATMLLWGPSGSEDLARELLEKHILKRYDVATTNH